MAASALSSVGAGVSLGLTSGCLFWAVESTLSLAFAEISACAYAFMLLLYLLAGALLGGGLGLAHAFATRAARAGRAADPRALPAAISAASLLGYSLYYLNANLTPDLGPLTLPSLAGDAVLFALSLLAFRTALVAVPDPPFSPLSYARFALPSAATLVALNLRFFAWGERHFETRSVIVAVVVFALAGGGGALIARRWKGTPSRPSPIRGVATALVVAALILYAASRGAFPSVRPFYQPAATRSEAVAAAAPNIVWIVMDTARRDQLSVYGNPNVRTERIASFAADGLVFDHAISASPWTLPSHASMFTGMYPTAHGVHHESQGELRRLPASALTLAEILSGEGYETAAAMANAAYLNHDYGLDQGFQFYFDERPAVYKLLWGRLLTSLPLALRTGPLRLNAACLASEINEVVYNWLGHRSPERPFFLFVNYMEAHDGIYHVPEPYDSMFDFDRRKYDEAFADFDMLEVVRGDAELTETQRRMEAARVGRKISSMDERFGELIEDLKARGLYDDSFIILTSDHGDLFGEHHSFDHQNDLYNELIWIPLIVKYPGSTPSGRYDGRVQTVDIPAELLFHLGLPAAATIQGQPFRDVSHPIVAELYSDPRLKLVSALPERFGRDLRAIIANRDGRTLKYIDASNGRSELFDLTADPAEDDNLIANEPQAAVGLRDELIRWRQGLARLSPAEDDTVFRSPELEERLRSLGYIE